jgi:hypothetical protein
VSRDVTLVLTDGANVFGALPPFQVSTPWWADVAIVIEAAGEIIGQGMTILRLLETSTPSSAMGGQVTYLTEIDRPPATRLLAWAGPDPLLPQRDRAWWAEPGELAEAVTWATATLAEDGIEVVGARQQRTWNLSVLVQLETSGGLVWLKAVPTFLADEGSVLRHLSVLDIAAETLPRVLGHDPSRRMALLADVPGVDLWDALAAEVVGLGRRVVDLHREAYERGVSIELADTVADRTTAGLVAGLDRLLGDDLSNGPMDPAVRAGAARLRDVLPSRLAPLGALPDVLTHGDPHPGNWRAGLNGERILLDWGDLAIASPLADIGRLTSRLPAGKAGSVRRTLIGTLAAAFCVDDLSDAIGVLPLLQAVTGAVQYADFCRNIEPSERVYHRDDVTVCLRDALDLIVGQDLRRPDQRSGVGGMTGPGPGPGVGGSGPGSGVGAGGTG